MNAYSILYTKSYDWLDSTRLQSLTSVTMNHLAWLKLNTNLKLIVLNYCSFWFFWKYIFGISSQSLKYFWKSNDFPKLNSHHKRFPSSFVKVIYFNVCCVPNYLTVNCINYYDNKQKKKEKWKMENGENFPLKWVMNWFWGRVRTEPTESGWKYIIITM